MESTTLPIALPTEGSAAARLLGAQPGAVRGLVEELRAEVPVGGVLDLSGTRLIGADLSGLDLRGVRLDGADLSRANLRGTNLLGARLVGAVLFETDLTDAECSGAHLSAAQLDHATAVRTGFGMASLQGASFRGANLTGASLIRANAQDADFRLAQLPGVRADGCDLRRADFTQAGLRGGSLTNTQVAGAIFDRADLRGASLVGLQGFEGARWIGADLREIDFTGAYLCRNFILDQNYLEEFRARSRWNGIVFRLWKATSDCGRSLTRWACCTGVATLLFAWIYTWVGVDYGDHRTWVSPLYYSVVTITTLGYGDVVPATAAAQIVVMFEVILGYVMLGGLLSIFANKMATRASA